MPEEKRPLKVFLCHASADKPKVKEYYRALKRRGFQPWLDEIDLLPGQDWQFEIPRAIDTSDAIIIFLTNESVDKAGYVQKEVKFALDKALELPEGRIFIIPARLEACDAPNSLKKYQWVDLFAKSGREKLISALTLLANQKNLSHKKPITKDKPDLEKNQKKNAWSKQKIRLKTQKLDKVLAFLENNLQKLYPKSKSRVVTLENYPDGIKRTITYTDTLSFPHRGKNGLVVLCDAHMTVFPGEFDVNAGETTVFNTYDALKFTGWETQTVYLEFEYANNWEDLANSLIDELYELFGKYDSNQKPMPESESKPFATSEQVQNIYNFNVGENQGNIIIGNENSAKNQASNRIPEKSPTPNASKINGDVPKTEQVVKEPSSLAEAYRAHAKKGDSKSATQAPPKKIKPEHKVAIAVAVIGAIATILAALIGILPQFFSPAPAPTPTNTQTLTAHETFTPTLTRLPTEITDPKGVTMRLVPAGEFRMGSDSRDNDEKPAHIVDLDDFYIDIYEVTNVRYKACVETGVCTLPQSTRSDTRKNYYGSPEFDNYPVIYVNWNQANTYCKWRGTRLPTEAEWEKAARSTDQRIYPWGSEGIEKRFANYGGFVGDTSEVGVYPAGISPYGLYDMAGNVWEWVADWYALYPNGSLENPTGPESGQYRVLRGGSWGYYGGGVLLVSDRDWYSPVDANSDIGFRCLRSP